MEAGPSDDSLEAAASHLRLAITRTARRLRQETAGDLTPTLAAALATIERHGPVTPSELAHLEQVSRPTATRTLRCLTRDGLVDRASDPEDGRSALVSISALGRERLRRMRRRKNVYLARRMNALPEADLDVLRRAAGILEAMVDRGERG